MTALLCAILLCAASAAADGKETGPVSDMAGNVFEREDDLLQHHFHVARDGFAALEKVIRFCCCGCGLCVSVCPEQSIVFDRDEKKPRCSGRCTNCGFCYLACPRSFLPLDRIERTFFGQAETEEQRRLGRFQDLFAGRSLTESIYRRGTPGGMTTSLVHYALQEGHVRAALLTKGVHSGVEFCMHPEPYIASDPDDALASARSKFEISPVLSKLRDLSAYESSLFVGTPCHITAFRKLQLLRTDPFIRQHKKGLAYVAGELTANVKFAVSINCFLNHTFMDRAYKWLDVQEEDIIRFNENVSKELLEKAQVDGEQWRWFLKSSVVTRSGGEKNYDLMQLGVLVLHSGCLVCNNLISCKHADASIGFFGAETHVRDLGWNSVAVMNPQLQNIIDQMIHDGKVQRKPLLKGYGKRLRKVLEWFVRTGFPVLDCMGVEQYLETGTWKYPRLLKQMKGPLGKPLILGLELFFLAQTIRKRMFNDGAVKALKKRGAYLTTVY